MIAENVYEFVRRNFYRREKRETEKQIGGLINEGAGFDVIMPAAIALSFFPQTQ